MHKSSYKMGVLGHFMNCVPLPPLLIPHSSLFRSVSRDSRINENHAKKAASRLLFIVLMLSLSDE